MGACSLALRWPAKGKIGRDKGGWALRPGPHRVALETELIEPQASPAQAPAPKTPALALVPRACCQVLGNKLLMDGPDPDQGASGPWPWQPVVGLA